MVLRNFSDLNILCIGDIILDSYIHGKVNRISPEAPIPIFKYESERFVLGGAGNVARNVVSGGGLCTLISVVGDDKEQKVLKKLIRETKNLKAELIFSDRKTSLKQRYISGQQQILRVDNESTKDIGQNCEKRVMEVFKKHIKRTDLVILSDYDKGVLTQRLLKKIILLSKKCNKTTIVDPKKRSFSVYSGSDIITPNLNELLKENNSNLFKHTSEEGLIRKISEELIKQYKFSSIITTRSSNGMTIVSRNNKSHNLSSKALEVYDVSGAGDTVVAYLSLSLASGMNIEESAKIANRAAGISVGKLGTACVFKDEVFENELFEKKIVSTNEAFFLLKKLSSTKKIGFTNGCFDLIHSGHISYLKKSKKYCDILILAINGDESVKKLKGKSRPSLSLDERIKILSSLEFIDLIITFDEPTPLKLIRKLKPDILFKGKDYKIEDVVGSKEILKWGGKTILINYEKNKSTTDIIKRIRNET